MTHDHRGNLGFLQTGSSAASTPKTDVPDQPSAFATFWAAAFAQGWAKAVSRLQGKGISVCVSRGGEVTELSPDGEHGVPHR